MATGLLVGSRSTRGSEVIAALEWGLEEFRMPVPVGGATSTSSTLSEYAKKVVVNLIKPSKYFLKK